MPFAKLVSPLANDPLAGQAANLHPPRKGKSERCHFAIQERWAALKALGHCHPIASLEHVAGKPSLSVDELHTSKRAHPRGALQRASLRVGTGFPRIVVPAYTRQK